MTLIGCFVTPHPPIVVPEVGGEEVAKVDATYQALRTLGRKVALLDPDTIVLLSPHSPLSRFQMGVSLASSFRGSLAHFRAPQVRLEALADEEVARSIMDEALAHGVPTVMTASPGEIVDLDHGAMVPLQFLTAELKRSYKLVSLSFSYLELEEHVRFGEVIWRVLTAIPTRTVYVASGDLSHRLNRGAPAGFDPRGADFDRAVVDSFAAGDWESLLSIEPGTVEAAGECGYRSLAVLSGIIQKVTATGGRTSNHVLSYEGPFGVGYLVGEIDIVMADQPMEALT
jgi:MEMO1 family protein